MRIRETRILLYVRVDVLNLLLEVPTSNGATVFFIWRSKAMFLYPVSPWIRESDQLFTLLHQTQAITVVYTRITRRTHTHTHCKSDTQGLGLDLDWLALRRLFLKFFLMFLCFRLFRERSCCCGRCRWCWCQRESLLHNYSCSQACIEEEEQAWCEDSCEKPSYPQHSHGKLVEIERVKTNRDVRYKSVRTRTGSERVFSETNRARLKTSLNNKSNDAASSLASETEQFNLESTHSFLELLFHPHSCLFLRIPCVQDWLQEWTRRRVLPVMPTLLYTAMPTRIWLVLSSWFVRRHTNVLTSLKSTNTKKNTQFDRFLSVSVSCASDFVRFKEQRKWNRNLESLSSACFSWLCSSCYLEWVGLSSKYILRVCLPFLSLFPCIFITCILKKTECQLKSNF